MYRSSLSAPVGKSLKVMECLFVSVKGRVSNLLRSITNKLYTIGVCLMAALISTAMGQCLLEVCCKTWRHFQQATLLLQIPLLLDAKTLRSEVQRIRTQHQIADSTAVHAHAELIEGLCHSSLVEELVHWVVTIASCHGFVISNFALAFADGSLLCRLVC